MKKAVYRPEGVNRLEVRNRRQNSSLFANATYPIDLAQESNEEFSRHWGLKAKVPGEGETVVGSSHLQSTVARPDELIEETVNGWVADKDRRYESVTALYSPQELGVRAFEHKSIEVSDEVFNFLKGGQQINEEANILLPYGSGNQHWDIQFTRGESVRRVLLSQHSGLRTAPDLIKACAGAGNCNELAMLACAIAGSRFKTTPVMQVAELGVDHTYVLIGDPRDPRYDESTVVVDPWPSFPTAHTLGVGVEIPYMASARPSRHEPFDPVHSSPVSKDYIDRLFRQLNKESPDETSVLNNVYAADAQHEFVYTQRTSGNDPSTVYWSRSNPSGLVIDNVPAYVVDRYDSYVQLNCDHRGPLFGGLNVVDDQPFPQNRHGVDTLWDSLNPPESPALTLSDLACLMEFDESYFDGNM